MGLKPTEWGSDPEFVGPRHAEREALMASVLLPELPERARVLDAGAGAGSFARLLAAAGHLVEGVDASAAFVAHANARGGATFRQGDVTALPFADASFDAVVAGEVLEHVEDDARAVAELYRVLAPGGLCLVTVPADPRLWDASDEWAGHVRRYEGQALERLFTTVGFTVDRCFRWGFPLMRLYHRHVYLPMLSRKGDAPSPPLTGWKLKVSAALALAFRFDRLFNGSPWGIGLLLVARKSALHNPQRDGGPIGVP